MVKPKVSSARVTAERLQVGRFGKSRLTHANALRKDYVELIADLLASKGEARPTDSARPLGVSHGEKSLDVLARVRAIVLLHDLVHRDARRFEHRHHRSNKFPVSASAS
jgi:hypothetical protein